MRSTSVGGGDPGEAEHRSEQPTRGVRPSRIRGHEDPGDPRRRDRVAGAARDVGHGELQRRGLRAPELRVQVVARASDERGEAVDVGGVRPQQRGDDDDAVGPAAGVHRVRGEHRTVPVRDRAAGRGQPDAARHLLLTGQLQRRSLGALQLPSVDAEEHQRRRERDRGRADEPGPRVAQARQGPQRPAAAVAADGQDDADRGQVDDQRGAAVAEQRERDAGQREQPEIAPHRHDRLDAQEDRETSADQGTVRCPRRARGQREPPHEEEREEHGPGPGDQPPLPDQARERQVGLPLGYVLRAQEAQGVVGPPEQRPRPHRDLRLPDRPAGAGRGLVRADQEAAEPLDLVRPQQTDRQRRRHRGRRGEGQQEPRRHAPDDQHGPGEDGEQGGRAQVGLGHGQRDRHEREQHGRHEALPFRQARPEHAGEDQQQPELGQLRRLEAERADPDPAGGAVRRRTRHEHPGEQGHARAVGQPADDAEQPDTEPPERGEGEESASRDHGLPDRQLRGACEGEVRQPEPDQRERRRHGEQVEGRTSAVTALLPGPSAPAGPRRRRYGRSSDRHLGSLARLTRTYTSRGGPAVPPRRQVAPSPRSPRPRRTPAAGRCPRQPLAATRPAP